VTRGPERLRPPLPSHGVMTGMQTVPSGALANEAHTVFADVIVTLHAPVPVHPPPDQPANV
jgi:hypothetical protein